MPFLLFAENAKEPTGNTIKMLVSLLKGTRQRVLARDFSVTATDNRQEVRTVLRDRN